MIRFDGHPATVYSLAFSPDSLLLASGAKDGGVRLWDAAGGLVREFHSKIDAPRNALAWSPSGAKLSTAFGSKVTTLTQVNGTRFDVEYQALVGEIASVAYLTDELFAFGIGTRAGTMTGGLHLWDATRRAPRPLPTPVQGANGVRAIAAHQHSKRLHWIAGKQGTPVCVWRSWVITSPNAVETNIGKSAAALAIGSDGTTVAIATDWLVKVFTAEGKMMGELTGHKGQVTGVGFIHGGRTVVSASWDETVRFWDVATKKETARFPVGIGKLTALAVSPDGTRVAAGGTDGPIVLIDAE